MSEKGVDWSNPEEVKAYQKTYREAHKEEQKEYQKTYYETNKKQIRAQNKKYRETHKEEQNKNSREYNAAHLVTKYYGYGGVCVCPKCIRRGYKSYSRRYNKKTGNYGKIKTHVQHMHSEDGKTVYDGTCFIGMGEL